MNKRKFIIIISIISFIFMLFMLLMYLQMSNSAKTKHLLNKYYPNCYVRDITFSYTDWSNSIQELTYEEDIKKATRVEYDIYDYDTRNFRVIRFEKSFIWWKITQDISNLKLSDKDDLYFCEIEPHFVGKAVNIDEHIKEHWIIPNKNKELYTIDNNPNYNSWYYRVIYVKAIYKVKSNNEVLQLNTETMEYEHSNHSYYDLVTFTTYTPCTENEVQEYIKYIPDNN